MIEGGDHAPRDRAVRMVGERGPTMRLADRADEGGGGRLGVLVGQLARADAVGEHLARGRRGSSRGREALGLDRGVDRLGQQRPGEAAPGERAAGEGLGAGGDPLGGGGAVRRRGGLAHRVDLALRGLAEDLGEELGLGGEVAVDRADRDSGPLGDGGDRRVDVAALGDQLKRRGDDALADLGPARLGPLGAPVGHRQEVNHGSHLVSTHDANGAAHLGGQPHKRQLAAAGSGSGRTITVSTTSSTSSAGMPTRFACSRTLSALVAW